MWLQLGREGGAMNMVGNLCFFYDNYSIFKFSSHLKDYNHLSYTHLLKQDKKTAYRNLERKSEDIGSVFLLLLIT